MGSSSSSRTRRGLQMNSSKVILVVVLMVVMIWDARKVEALTKAECKEERRLLVSACKDVVGGNPASAYCCQRIRVTHTDCVCPVITPKLAALIDVNRAIRIIQGCGRKIPRHYKCGSITTP